jgi:SAM-dependent methyltransferase
MSLRNWIDRRCYPAYGDRWDDWLFRARILSALDPDFIVLDLGAGAGIVEAMDFRGHAARICGIDLDPRVLENPFLDEAMIGDVGRLPYSDSTFDVVFADNVMEHIAEPKTAYAEIARVLKPGGIFLFKTPNLWHYMPAIARFTPLWFHRFYNRVRGRAQIDTFPTLYRSNTEKTVHRLARMNGFRDSSTDLIEGRPEYLRLTVLTYIVGLLYERLVNAFEGLRRFRILLLAELRR